MRAWLWLPYILGTIKHICWRALCSAASVALRRGLADAGGAAAGALRAAGSAAEYPTARRWNTKLLRLLPVVLFRAARIRQLRAAAERPRLPLTFMPRVLLVVVAFAAATTALPHRLRRAKPEKSAADDHAPKPRTPSLAALESFLGGTAAEPVSRTLDGLDPEVALERASLTGMAREVGRLPDWDTVDGEKFSVLMEVGRTFRSSRGDLVGPDVAQGKAACDKNRKWQVLPTHARARLRARLSPHPSNGWQEKLREAELEAEAYETAEGRPAYETLGLPETATAAEIKQKYEELLRTLPKFKKMRKSVLQVRARRRRQEYKKAKDIALAVAQEREVAN